MDRGAGDDEDWSRSDHDDTVEPALAGLPDPSTRTWRHPSELGSFAPTAPATTRTSQIIGISLLTALVGVSLFFRLGPDDVTSAPSAAPSTHETTTALATVTQTPVAPATSGVVPAVPSAAESGPAAAASPATSPTTRSTTTRQFSSTSSEPSTTTSATTTTAPSTTSLTSVTSTIASAATETPVSATPIIQPKPAAIAVGDGHLLVAAWARPSDNEAADLLVDVGSGNTRAAHIAGRDESTGLTVLTVSDAVETGPVGRCTELHLGESVDVSTHQETVPGTVTGAMARLKLDDGRSIGPVVRVTITSDMPAGGSPTIRFGGKTVAVIVARGDNHSVYAIPIEVANASARVLASGSKELSWMGIAGINDHGGVRVVGVDDGSPAATGGLTADDVIDAVNNEPVDSMYALLVHVRAATPGSKLTLTVTTGSERRTVEVELSGRSPDA